MCLLVPIVQGLQWAAGDGMRYFREWLTGDSISIATATAHNTIKQLTMPIPAFEFSYIYAWCSLYQERSVAMIFQHHDVMKVLCCGPRCLAILVSSFTTASVEQYLHDNCLRGAGISTPRIILVIMDAVCIHIAEFDSWG